MHTCTPSECNGVQHMQPVHTIAHRRCARVHRLHNLLGGKRVLKGCYAYDMFVKKREKDTKHKTTQINLLSITIN